MPQLTVHFPNGQRNIATDTGSTSLALVDLLRSANLVLNTRCGQRGLCDGCFVELCSGSLLPTHGGSPVLPDTSPDASPRALRACQHCVSPGSDVVIRVPARSLLAHKPQIVTSFSVDVTCAHDPLWQRIELPTPQRRDGETRIDALCRAVMQEREADLPIRASKALRQNGITQENDQETPLLHLVLEQRGDHWLLLPPDSGQPAYGVAIDIGTTTVVVMLVNLATGMIAGSSSALNAQTRLGDNVLTRINLCLSEDRWVRRLQQMLVRKTVTPLIEQLLAQANLSEDQLVSVVVSGNTTMLHLAAGVHPGSLGTSPFTPQFLDHRVLFRSRHSPSDSRDRDDSSPVDGGSGEEPNGVQTRESSGPVIHLLPGAAAYVGADVVAGVLATGMAYREEPSLLVDIGTNGEILLKRGNRILGCATAAGPAFEGAGMRCGVRAQEGAISHVRLQDQPDRPQLELIGDGKPMGICGTAYVDFLAQARLAGILNSTGRFRESWMTHSRILDCSHGHAFRLATGRDEKPIVISEADIASLLQAKAAIAAGIVCLLQQVGLASQDIHTLYLAGGFGFHMDIQNVIACGLLPGFQPEQIHMVGNTSLAGAYLSLLDSSVLTELQRIARRIEIVELNQVPEFESIYIDHLLLPAP